MHNNPFTSVLREAQLDPPEWESCRVSHLLKSLLLLGESTYRGPNTHINAGTEVRQRLRQAGVSKLVTETAFFDAMERRLS